jgi:Icc-related predicted phosphoesterase
MKIISLPDLHARTGMLTKMKDQLKNADAVILCGDITHFGHEQEVQEIIGLVRTMNENILAVSGNCDFPDVERYLVRENYSVNAMLKLFSGYVFLGISGSLPCPGRTPNEYSEAEYAVILNAIKIPSGEPLILVSHQPPYDTCNDEVSPGFHVGSKVIRQFIEEKQPVVCFTGHIHEGTGIDYIGRTAVVNPGPAGKGGYAWADFSDAHAIKLEVRHV